MKGSYHFRVSGKRAVFEFTIRRNITIIKGDSGSGKTTLLNMLYEYLRVGRESGFSVSTSAPYYVYMRREVGRDWLEALDRYRDTVIFIEENNDFVFTEEFAKYVKSSGNYVVIVNRAPLHMLPYSIHEIYQIITDNKNKQMRESYHEFRELYSNFPMLSMGDGSVIISEDSNSGYRFFEHIYAPQKVTSAGGNSGVSKSIENETAKEILAIVDGAAFGAFIEETLSTIASRSDKRVLLWLPESFEYLILKSGLLGEQVTDDIDNLPELIDSTEYESWEQYFTSLLVRITADSEHPYSKSRLDSFYLRPDSVEVICSQFPEEIRP